MNNKIIYGVCQMCGDDLPPDRPGKPGPKRKYCAECARDVKNQTSRDHYRDSRANETPEQRESRMRYMRAYNRQRNRKRAEALAKVKAMEEADLVAVVRCKDCKHLFGAAGAWCPYTFAACKDDHFCSYGERKEI